MILYCCTNDDTAAAAKLYRLPSLAVFFRKPHTAPRHQFKVCLVHGSDCCYWWYCYCYRPVPVAADKDTAPKHETVKPVEPNETQLDTHAHTDFSTKLIVDIFGPCTLGAKWYSKKHEKLITPEAFSN